MLAIKHQNGQVGPRCSLSLMLPSKEDLLDILVNCKSDIPLVFGITFVHPKDEFVKSIGRQKSFSKTKVYFFSFSEAKIRSEFCNKVLFTFVTPVKNLNNLYFVEIGISYTPNSPQVRLEYAVVS